MRALLLCACALFALPFTAGAQPLPDSLFSAANDAYSVFNDSVLTVTAPGLVANDTTAGADSVVVVLVNGPENGTLTIEENGAFTYTPAPGFIGVDQFTYHLQTYPFQTLAIDVDRSQIIFDATLDTPVGDDAAHDSSHVEGTITLDALPSAEPFSEVQITALDVINAEAINLGFKFGGIITVGRINVDVDPGALNVSLVEGGARTLIAENVFLQTTNTVGVTGSLQLDGTGVFNNQVPEEPQLLETETEIDLPGVLTTVNDSLELALVIDIVKNDIDLSGNMVDLVLSDTVFARGPVVLPQSSNLAVVEIVVDQTSGGTSIADDVPDRYALDQNYPNPFNPVTTIAFSLEAPQHVRLTVYDALGREVATLVDGFQGSGRHEVRFDAGRLPSGMYIYQIQAGSFTAQRKLVLTK